MTQERKTLVMATAGTVIGLYDWIATAALLSFGFFAFSYLVFWVDLRDALSSQQERADG